MSRRLKHRTITMRDIRSLENVAPTSWLILAAIVIGGVVFIVGTCLIISFDLPVDAVFTLALLTFPLIIGISVAFVKRYNQEIEKKYRGMQIANIDYMTGIEFEHYLRRVLASQGYSVSTTSISGDLGVDLVALGNGNKIAIQAKRYHNKVSRYAVSDAVAGMQHYGCNKAMVITNSYFSPGAIELARSTGCILVDRDILAKWVNDYQNPQSRDTEITQPTKTHNRT